MTATAIPAGDVLDLPKLRRKVSVKLPVGLTFTVAPFEALGIATLRAYEAESDPDRKGALLVELVLMALPGATNDDLDGTGPEDWSQIVAAAQGRALLVEAALGNGPGAGEAAPANDTQDSTTTTPSPASSPESRAPSVKHLAT